MPGGAEFAGLWTADSQPVGRAKSARHTERVIVDLRQWQESRVPEGSPRHAVQRPHRHHGSDVSQATDSFSSAASAAQQDVARSAEM